MKDKEIRDWIEKAKAKGFNKNRIEEFLIKEGYSLGEIKYILSFYRTRKLKEKNDIKKRIRRRKVKKIKQSKKKKRVRNVVKIISQKSALSDAIRDIDREINQLAKERENLKITIGNLTLDIKGDKKSEKELRTRIGKLINEEKRLWAKNNALQKRLNIIVKKMGKMSKIRSEMSSV